MAVTIPIGFAEVSVNIASSFTARLSAITFGVPYTDGTNLGEFRAQLEDSLPDLLQDMSTNYASPSFTVTAPLVGGGTGSFTLPWSAGALVGATSGEAMQPGTAYLYKKRTVALGRGSYGRFYLPGVVESKVDGGGLIDPDFLEDMNNHAATFFTSMAAGSAGGIELPLQVLSAQRGALELISLSVEEKVATQRRRLR